MKRKIIRRIIVFLLAVFMIFGTFVTTFAEEDNAYKINKLAEIGNFKGGN